MGLKNLPNIIPHQENQKPPIGVGHALKITYVIIKKLKSYWCQTQQRESKGKRQYRG